MIIIKSRSGLEDLNLKKPVVTWGIFDGVHKGHQKIIRTLTAIANKLKGDSVILTFDTHPEGIVNSGGPPMLNSLHHRIKLLSRFGVDVCAVLPFDKKFARITAEDFAGGWLIETLGTKGIVLGQHTTFGKNRSGNLQFLGRMCRLHGVKLAVCSHFMYKSRPVSSTRIRAAVLEGALDEAAKMLGRRYSLLGRVIHGMRMGKKLGFPTANIEPLNEALPPDGVYTAKVNLGRKTYDGLISIGTRPTFAGRGNAERAIEVHLRGFAGNIYGRELEAEFTAFIRKQIKFSSVEALVRQIGRDAMFLDKTSKSAR